MRGGHREVEKEGFGIFRVVLDVVDGAARNFGEDLVEFPVRGDGRSGEPYWHDNTFVGVVRITFGGLFDDAVVFDEGERREIGDVRAEVVVEPARDRAVLDGFGVVPLEFLKRVSLFYHDAGLIARPVPAEMPFAYDCGFVSVFL